MSATRTETVTVVLPSLAGGGAERVMLTVAGGLAGEGRDVRLLLGNTRGPLARELPSGVVVEDLGCAHVRQMAPRLVTHLRRDRPGCVLSTLDHANVASLLARTVSGTRTPVVVRVANTLSEVARAPVSRKDRVTVAAARLLYRTAAAVVAPSQGVADDLGRFTGRPARGGVRVIPNPVVGADVAARAAAPVAHPWLAGGGPPVVLSVGSLTAKKNHGLVLRAVADLRAVRPVRLLVLGEGPEHDRLLREATGLGLRPGEDVDLPGWVADPFPYLARCSVFVLGSDREGLPGALIQALACGARVVATDCRSGPREILDAGRLGRLVPVGDVAAMRAAVAATLDEHEAGAPRPDPWPVLARYTETAAVTAYGALVDELATAGSRRGR